ncbi:MAG TPA: hypothetical protein VKA63_01650, partial [Candidatus Krumholzibacteria bacterium]|nr:hypothetical protein [Candidatus Krumholzibacteria bacterium]
MFASEPRRGSTGLPLILLLLLLAAPLYGCSKSTKEESSARDTQSAQQPPAPTGQSAQQPPAPTSRSAEQTPAPKGQSAANLPDFAQAVARSQGPSKEAQEEAAAARTKEAQQKAQKVLERARAATHVTKEALEKIIVGRASGSGSDGS